MDCFAWEGDMPIGHQRLFGQFRQTPDPLPDWPLCSRTMSRIIGRHLPHLGEIPSAL
jgi:hypothetical protein